MKTPTANPSQQIIIGSMFVVIAAASFSSKAILIKLAYGFGDSVSPIVLMTLRMAIALPIFLLVLYVIEKKTSTKALTKKEWSQLLGLGCIGYYLAAYLDFVGLSYISASLERLVLLLYPTLVVMISVIMFKHKITRRETIALSVSYLGILVVFAQELSLAGNNVVLGSALIFGSALAFAIYLVGSGVMVRRIGAMRFTAYAMSIACLSTMIHFSLDYDAAIFSLPTEVYGLSLLMAVMATVIPTFMMNLGMQRIGANPASIISSLGPVMTIFLAYVFLGESLTAMQAIGAMLVVLGVTVVSYKKGKSV